MADLKFGNVTPAVGNIKLGSNNVSEIYQGTTKLWPLGTPPQPGEVTVCDLIWTKTNSTITATTTGGNIPIVTNKTDWYNLSQNNQPAATYKDFDSNNSFRGLYYNVFATEVIQPPAGFRVPTQQDWYDLIICAGAGSPNSSIDVTSLANNYYGFWPSNVASNPRFGTVDFNSIGSGFPAIDSNSYGWFSQGRRDLYWQQQPGSLPASSYRITQFLKTGTRDWIAGYYISSFNDGFATGKDGAALMRFVKDASPPATVTFYYNDTQTGSGAASLNNYGFMASTSSGLTVANQFANISFEIIGGPATIKFVAYNDQGLANPPNARFTEIKWEIYDNVSRSPITDLVHETIWSSSTAGSDPYPIRPTTPTTTPQGQPGYKIENWGTDSGSVTLNPGVYYVEMKMTFGNEFSGASAGTNYIMSFET